MGLGGHAPSYAPPTEDITWLSLSLVGLWPNGRNSPISLIWRINDGKFV